jgi:hypothetical protein
MDNNKNQLSKFVEKLVKELGYKPATQLQTASLKGLLKEIKKTIPNFEFKVFPEGLVVFYPLKNKDDVEKSLYSIFKLVHAPPYDKTDYIKGTRGASVYEWREWEEYIE